MVGASGISETSFLAPLESQDVTIGASGRSQWSMVCRLQSVPSAASSGASGQSSWAMDFGGLVSFTEPIPPGPARGHGPAFTYEGVGL